ncbi:MAG: carboxypeptidase-like regulatory domain-containing protein [Chitinophagales bacterium]|nr:carboxypeptidase-like regulatory domain-containing protein [Chitinophagales bacterium]
MIKFNSLLTVLIVLLACNLSMAQSPRLIQYSGVVLSTDSSTTPVPFASVYNKSIKLGAIANFQGFFTFAARVGDTIEITSVGYQKGLVVVPDIPDKESYTALIFLQPDIKMLPEARVYPWFSKDQFRDAFVHLNIPDDDLERARKNLDANKLRELGETLKDGTLNATKSLQNYSYTYYYAGQYQPQAILSPSAWMQFFNALQNGAFKKK